MKPPDGLMDQTAIGGSELISIGERHVFRRRSNEFLRAGRAKFSVLRCFGATSAT